MSFISITARPLWLLTLPLQRFMLWQFITISGGFRTPWYLNIWPLLRCSKVCHTELWMIHIENTDGACWVFFFLLPNNTQSKSPYMTVIFFVSASKRTKQHISSASFDRFWDGARSVRARKELLFQSCTEYMRGSCKINQDRTASSFPVKIPFLTPEIHGLATIQLWTLFFDVFLFNISFKLQLNYIFLLKIIKHFSLE